MSSLEEEHSSRPTDAADAADADYFSVCKGCGEDVNVQFSWCLCRIWQSRRSLSNGVALRVPDTVLGEMRSARKAGERAKRLAPCGAGDEWAALLHCDELHCFEDVLPANKEGEEGGDVAAPPPPSTPAEHLHKKVKLEVQSNMYVSASRRLCLNASKVSDDKPTAKKSSTPSKTKPSATLPSNQKTLKVWAGGARE